MFRCIRLGVLGLCVVIFATAAGCGPGSAVHQAAGPTKQHAGGYPYRVVTTCGMVTDIVQIVAGDRATVTGLMGEGVDPHLYHPTRADVRQLMDADVVIYSGLMLEGRMGETFSKIALTGKPVAAVTDGIDRSLLRVPPEFAGHFDPHVWMDVRAWSECVAHVATVLGKYDPQNAEYYQENAKRYRNELSGLDNYVRRVTASIPEGQRVLITSHDAFGYFGRAYGIEVKSPQGLSTESQPSVEDIVGLVDFVVERKIGAIFAESSVNPKSIQAVIEGAASRGQTVVIGGKLFSDAMGKPGTYQGTYVGMIDHNATTIARALGGEAPESGFRDEPVTGENESQRENESQPNNETASASK